MKRLVQIAIAFFIIALLRIKNKQASANDLPGMLGYDIERDNHDWIDPDDMGLSTGTLVKSPKKTETTTSMPNKNELNNLQEEIRILKRNISLMLEENLKLNQTNLELRNKIMTISTNLSHQNNSKVQNDVIKTPGDSDRGWNHMSKRKIENPFIIRFVKILTRKLQIDKDEETLSWKTETIKSKKERYLRYAATLGISEKGVNVLRSLSKATKSQNNTIVGLLYDIDEVFSNLIIHADPEMTIETKGTFSFRNITFMLHQLPSENVLAFALFLTSLVVTIVRLYTGRLSVWKFLSLLFVISGVWHWTRMYKKAIAEKHVTLSKSKWIPKECFPESMSWSHFLLDRIFVSQDKCKEYYEALMIDPLLEVTPTMALAETFTAFIVQPMEHLGRHIGKFFNALLQETSWLSSPVILSFVFVAILLCLVMIFNYRFRLPFFLGSFEPRNNLSDSFAIERKEQKNIIMELKETIESLKMVDTPQKRVSCLKLEDNSSRLEALQFDPCQELDLQNATKETVRESSINKNSPSIKNCLKKGNNNVSKKIRRTNSSPSKICVNILGHSVLDEMNPYDITHRVAKNENKCDSRNEASKSNPNQGEYQSVNTDEVALESPKNLSMSSPKERLVIKTNDKCPNETDFEWITEMLDDKLAEVQESPNKLQEKQFDHENEMNPAESDFIVKAKDVFGEILQD